MHSTLVGLPGAGKTLLGSTYPKPMFVFDIDQGTKTIESVDGVDFLRFLPDGVRNADGWLHQEPKSGLDLFRQLAKGILRSGKYASCMMDGQTGLWRLFSECVPVPTTAGNKANTQKWYGMFLQIVSEVRTVFESFQGHMIWTCHIREVYDSNGNFARWEPAIIGQSKTIIPAGSDEVWLLEANEDKTRTLYTHKPNFPGLKTRHWLPDKIHKPSWPVIEKILRSGP